MSPSINPDKVKEYLDLLGDSTREIYETFQDSLQKHWGDLQTKMAGSAGLQEIKGEAHTIKGMCLSCGADNLAQLCLQMETAVNEDRKEEIESIFNQLGSEVRRALQENEELLKKL